jgi:hypothetical protein
MTETERAEFLAQFAKAKEEVRRLKIAAPYLLPEYQNMKQAEADLRRAQERFDRARRAWEEL